MSSTQGRLGHQLIKQGLLTEDQLSKALLTQRALATQRGVVKPLGEILIDLQLISEQDILSVLSAQLGVPCIDVDKYDVDVRTLASVPEKIAREKRLIPISRIETTLTVAMTNPSDLSTIDEIEFLSGCEVIPVLASRQSIIRAIDRSYPRLAETDHDELQAKPPEYLGDDLVEVAEEEEDDVPPAPFEGVSDEDLGIASSKPVSEEARNQLDLKREYANKKDYNDGDKNHVADVDEFLESLQQPNQNEDEEEYEFAPFEDVLDGIPTREQPEDDYTTVNVGVVSIEDDFDTSDTLPKQTAPKPRPVEIPHDETLVSSLVEKAMQKNASHIYLEFDSNEVWIRFRMGNRLEQISEFDTALANSLIVSLKRLAKLDIHNTRNPQSGIGIVNVGGRRVQVIIGEIPTITGTSMVVNILKKHKNLNLKELGMNNKVLQQLRDIIKEPFGTILIVGPPASGKNLTMYALLSEFDHAQKKIIDIQTTIDHYVPTINQIQIDPSVDLSFVNTLQTAIQYHPDVLVLGEMSDLATAEMGFRVGLNTLLISSFVSPNPYQAVAGLKSIGLDSMLLGSSLRGIIHQRLVKKICENCRKTYQPSKEIADRIKASVRIKDVVFYKGEGCDTCQGTGFDGETILYEFIPITTEVRVRILSDTLPELFEKAIAHARLRSLKQDGLEKVLRGITTYEEMIRVI